MLASRSSMTIWLSDAPSGRRYFLAWSCTLFAIVVPSWQDLLLAVLLETDEIKLAPNHAEMPSLLARMKPSALVKHVLKQRVRMVLKSKRWRWKS